MLPLWVDRLLGRPPPPPLSDPAARVQFFLNRMRPAARARAEAVRREAIEDFGSEQAADDWLCASIPFLGDRRPIEIIHTARGAGEAHTCLNNMRWGIYS
ncbi:MAG TPA: DUF2384 domain-containing protein [Beijerinckiaceae bacterium]|nr:DUF2384 domain-containing protein [Beijerinckiaceae bacterium]